MGELPKPFGADNPVLAGAFGAFVGWAWEQPNLHADYCAETGTIPLATDPLVVLIDAATGLKDEYVVGFISWLIRSHWGEEEAAQPDSPPNPVVEAGE